MRTVFSRRVAPTELNEPSTTQLICDGDNDTLPLLTAADVTTGNLIHVEPAQTEPDYPGLGLTRQVRLTLDASLPKRSEVLCVDLIGGCPQADRTSQQPQHLGRALALEEMTISGSHHIVILRTWGVGWDGCQVKRYSPLTTPTDNKATHPRKKPASLEKQQPQRRIVHHVATGLSTTGLSTMSQLRTLEGMTGIEPASSAWKAEVLATIRHSLACSHAVHESNALARRNKTPAPAVVVGRDALKRKGHGRRADIPAIDCRCRRRHVFA